MARLVGFFDQEALRARGVSGGVDQPNADPSQFDDVARIMTDEFALRNPRHLSGPRRLELVDVNRCGVELEKLVQKKLDSGLYYTASEVIREALRLLKEHDELRQRRIDQIRKKIARGIEQLDRGEGVDGEEFFEELQRKGQRRRRKRA